MAKPKKKLPRLRRVTDSEELARLVNGDVIMMIPDDPDNDGGEFEGGAIFKVEPADEREGDDQ